MQTNILLSANDECDLSDGIFRGEVQILQLDANILLSANDECDLSDGILRVEWCQGQS